MRNKERFILKKLFVMGSLCVVQLSCANHRTEKYIGIDEIRENEVSLSLVPENMFIMKTLLTDSIRNQGKCDTLKGKWIKKDQLLILISNDNKVCYKLNPDKVSIGGKEFNTERYTFISNNKDFFGTNIDLTSDRND